MITNRTTSAARNGTMPLRMEYMGMSPAIPRMTNTFRPTGA